MYRLPIALYRWRLGWLLGGRFVLLEHVGRKTGQQRQTVLEVVRYDQPSDTYIIIAGFGRQTDWFQNVLAAPIARVQVGRRHALVIARELSTDATTLELLAYRRHHPFAARLIAPVLKIPLDGTAEQLAAAAELLPMVALGVRDS